jgi:hypothetical protein
MTGRKVAVRAEEVGFDGDRVAEGAGPRGRPVVHGGTPVAGRWLDRGRCRPTRMACGAWRRAGGRPVAVRPCSLMMGLRFASIITNGGLARQPRLSRTGYGH